MCCIVCHKISISFFDCSYFYLLFFIEHLCSFICCLVPTPYVQVMWYAGTLSEQVAHHQHVECFIAESTIFPLKEASALRYQSAKKYRRLKCVLLTVASQKNVHSFVFLFFRLINVHYNVLLHNEMYTVFVFIYLSPDSYSLQLTTAKASSKRKSMSSP